MGSGGEQVLVKDAAAQSAQSVLDANWGSSLPIDPALVAERLGVAVRRVSLPKDTSGLIIKRPNEDAQILVERSDSVLRQRFTIAHELGHFIERTTVQGTPDEEFGFVDRRHTRTHDLHEFFANEFAGNLLMPKEELTQRFAANPDPIRLAADFGVSIPALKTRLLKLRLIS